MKPAIGIIGIGNPLMGDDGIGVTILNRLKEDPDIVPKLDGEAGSALQFIELGAGGMNVLHYLAKFDAALIIDSGNMDLTPGEFRVFTPEEVTSVKFLSGQSLHEFDLLQAIEMSKKLGECPPSLMIMAIQPESVSWGEGLSPALQDSTNDYVIEARKIIGTLIESADNCNE